ASEHRFSWADTVSLLDYRYYGPSERLRPKVHSYLSEAVNFCYFLWVEVVFVYGLAAAGVCTPAQADEIARACDQVTFEEVHAEEERTQHNVRALVNVIARRVSPAAQPFIH